MVDWQDFYTAVRGIKLYLNFDFLVYLWRAAFKSGDSLSSNWIYTLGLKRITTKTTKEGLLIINMQVHFVPRLVYPSKNPSPPARLLPPQGSSLPGYNLLLPILQVLQFSYGWGDLINSLRRGLPDICWLLEGKLTYHWVSTDLSL